MATVNLSWTVEGLHDGIRVTRKFSGYVDYLDTLPAGTTEFEDDFSISALAEHYNTDPEGLDLLVYTLTTFRGDKEKSTTVPVPVEDTDPEWIQNLDWPEYTDLLESVEIPILTSGHNAAISTKQYGSEDKLFIFFANADYEGFALKPWSEGGDPYANDFDFTQLHYLDFTRMLNSQINNDSVPLMSDVLVGEGESPFASESYTIGFYADAPFVNGLYVPPFSPELYVNEGQSPDYFFLSAPYVDSDQSLNDAITGMAIDVFNNKEGELNRETIPWSPQLQGVYVYVTQISVVNMPPKPE